MKLKKSKRWKNTWKDKKKIKYLIKMFNFSFLKKKKEKENYIIKLHIAWTIIINEIMIYVHNKMQMNNYTFKVTKL